MSFPASIKGSSKTVIATSSDDSHSFTSTTFTVIVRLVVASIINSVSVSELLGSDHVTV